MFKNCIHLQFVGCLLPPLSTHSAHAGCLLPPLSTHSAHEGHRVPVVGCLATLLADAGPTEGTVGPRVEEPTEGLLAAGTLRLVLQLLLPVLFLLHLLPHGPVAVGSRMTHYMCPGVQTQYFNVQTISAYNSAVKTLAVEELCLLVNAPSRVLVPDFNWHGSWPQGRSEHRYISSNACIL